MCVVSSVVERGMEQQGGKGRHSWRPCAAAGCREATTLPLASPCGAMGQAAQASQVWRRVVEYEVVVTTAATCWAPAHNSAPPRLDSRPAYPIKGSPDVARLQALLHVRKAAHVLAPQPGKAAAVARAIQVIPARRWRGDAEIGAECSRCQAGQVGN